MRHGLESESKQRATLAGLGVHHLRHGALSIVVRRRFRPGLRPDLASRRAAFASLSQLRP